MNRIGEFLQWVKEHKDQVIEWQVQGMQMQTGLPFAAHNLEIVFPDFSQEPIIEIIADVDRLTGGETDRARMYLPAEDRLEFSRDSSQRPIAPAMILVPDHEPIELEWNETVETFLDYQPFEVNHLDGWTLQSVLEAIESYLTVKSNFMFFPKLSYQPTDISKEIHADRIEQAEFLVEVQDWFKALPKNAVISWHSPNLTPEAPYSHHWVEIGIDGIDEWDWTWLLMNEAQTPADAADPFMLFTRPDANIFYRLREADYDLQSVLMYLPNNEKYLLPPLSMPPFSHPECYQTKRNEKIAVYSAPAWSPKSVTVALKEWIATVANRPDIEVVWAWRAVQSSEHQELLIEACEHDQLRDQFIANGTWVTTTCADWYNSLAPHDQQRAWGALEEYLDSLSGISNLEFKV